MITASQSLMPIGITYLYGCVHHLCEERDATDEVRHLRARVAEPRMGARRLGGEPRAAGADDDAGAGGVGAQGEVVDRLGQAEPDPEPARWQVEVRRREVAAQRGGQRVA